ncbi:4a-hydroxytetrahydrobiopterin dehydratase [Streptomyces sodiiphilus]|uniref:Putative pterin-4-alpha-carbinolamine dehydratase n=1 Tax=Streptomyces sodiiphilus TaxID=226217 RepID=A0ABN2PBB8_9ACTN
MAPQPLTETDIAEALSGLPGWTLEENRLVRSYGFDGHLPAVAMLVHIAAIHEEMDHHADLALGYNRLGVAVHTHSAGGRVTELDTRLARRIEEIAAGHGAR